MVVLCLKLAFFKKIKNLLNMLNSLLNMLNPYTVGLTYIIPLFVKHVKQKEYFNYFCVKHVYTPTSPNLLPFPP